MLIFHYSSVGLSPLSRKYFKKSRQFFVMLNLYFSLFYFGEINHLPLFMKSRIKLPVEYCVSPLIMFLLDKHINDYNIQFNKIPIPLIIDCCLMSNKQ